MYQTSNNFVSRSSQPDASYTKYMSLKYAQPSPNAPVRTQTTHDVIESANGAFSAPNLAGKTPFGGDITGKVYLRSVHGSETPYAVQFYFERDPAEKHKGELLRIFSRTGVHLLDWKQVGDSLQAELNAAAWVTVHDGHDFGARVLIRITVNRSRPDAPQEIELFLSADNRRYNNARIFKVVMPVTAGERGAIHVKQRVSLAA
ncbi:MAG: hypothetical protein H8F28_19720 [Fibrella sp.]|nr:hypothetical protein [Armatimonadota bacterium]